jgi:hypothetical protein
MRLRIRKQSKGSVSYIFGRFCQTNPLSVFVRNGRKRGPASAQQLQSSSLLEDLLNVYQTWHHGLLPSLFRHPDVRLHQAKQFVLQQRPACQQTRQKGIAAIGGQAGFVERAHKTACTPH